MKIKKLDLIKKFNLLYFNFYKVSDLVTHKQFFLIAFGNAFLINYRKENRFSVFLNQVKLIFKHDVLRTPVYYEYFSRDCDMLETGGVKKAKSYRSYLEQQTEFLSNTTGYSYHNMISKEEYLERRDIANKENYNYQNYLFV